MILNQLHLNVMYVPSGLRVESCIILYLDIEAKIYDGGEYVNLEQEFLLWVTRK